MTQGTLQKCFQEHWFACILMEKPGGLTSSGRASGEVWLQETNPEI